MRYHKAGNTLRMLMDPAIPRRPDGALNICHHCQRGMWFAGGYLNWVANCLISLARANEQYGRIPKFVAQMAVGEYRVWRISNSSWRETTRERIAELAHELERNFRVRTWTGGKVEVWRLSDDNDEARAEVAASGMEARRAETGTGSVHDSPAPKADAQELSRTRPDGRGGQ